MNARVAIMGYSCRLNFRDESIDRSMQPFLITFGKSVVGTETNVALPAKLRDSSDYR